VASVKAEKMSDSDKEQMTNVLSQMTEMNSKWCRKWVLWYFFSLACLAV